jgi:hypothetical protein
MEKLKQAIENAKGEAKNPLMGEIPSGVQTDLALLGFKRIDKKDVTVSDNRYFVKVASGMIHSDKIKKTKNLAIISPIAAGQFELSFKK